MPIRLRILLLALVTVLGVAGGLYVQYREIDADITALEHETAVIEQARRTSQLVHALQKERGLSAGFMVDGDEQHRSVLAAQRRQTRVILDALVSGTGNPSLLPAGWLGDFSEKLAAVRGAVDTGGQSWEAVRVAYTDAIRDALDAIAMEGRGRGIGFQAVVDLATAREALGLIRATVNRIYSRGHAVTSDLVDAARFYGAFAENLRAFYRDSPAGRRDAHRTRIETDVFRGVRRQVEEILYGARQEGAERSPFLWWDEATLVIDTLKAVEDQVYGDITAQARVATATERTRMIGYGMAAMALLLVVGLLTVVTVLRILNALSVLLSTLGEVVRTQDFGIRILGDKTGDEFGRIGLSVNRLLDYTDALIREKDHLASTDLLTGGLNRRSFLEAAAREMERGQRYGTAVSLVLADIDHFKAINDSHGHDVGDEVLRRFSSLLKKHIRGSDVLGRWGGEEFVVLVPESDAGQAAALAEKLRREVEAEAFPQVGSVTCSFGVAERQPDEAFDALTKRADAALYKAKNAGRNRVEAA